ncbi:TRAP-type transport system, periplasmic component, predicted N-acetylneuraminate-binding protein [plant metagenome]|uniref:TRAP-type transport system, periplasmic component, predicted N-acetylneuraminate-binding protein n=1 Tax=plant metagenome TaxID=1297885 RepID=A0A484QI50_9ZZZZ
MPRSAPFKRLALAAALSALALSTLPAHAQQKKREIKVSHAQQATLDSELQIAAWIFRNYVNENAETLNVRIFPNNALGDERSVYEGMQLGGGATCALGGTAILNTFSPRLGVVDLPFLWKDYDHMNRSLDGDVGKQLSAELEKSGLKTVGWLTNWGFRNVITANKPVTKPEDLKGLKIRTIQSPVYIEALNAMGANATPMSFGEVYSAMQTGVLDGFEHGPAVVLTGKYYEVTKHVALTRHFLGPAIFACSLNEWKQLTDKERDVLAQGVKLASDINRSLAPVREAQALDQLRARGMQVHEIDTTSFQQNAVKIQDKFAADRKAEDLLTLIRDAGNQANGQAK